MVVTPPKIKIAVLNSHPIQYFAPLYAYISRSPDVAVTAFYLSDFSIRGAEDQGFGQVVKWDIDLLAGYEHKFVAHASKTGPSTGFFSIVAPDLWGEVRKGGFDALWLHGHDLAANHVALAAAKSIGIPVFMRGETHLGLTRNSTKQALRRPLLGSLYWACDGFLAIGSANKAFYRAMGVPEEKISLVPYTVDNERFTRASSLSSEDRLAMRATLGLSPDRPAVLYASKFQRRKHPDDLVRAAQKLVGEGLAFDLVMVGSGEMETELKALVAAGGPAGTVFPGFVNQMDLPRVFGACDVFVLPSEEEPWGLIVNEAMCAGLPIVVASEVGCVPDLLREGENGHSFPARDVDGLAAALRPIIADAALRQSMSAKSRAIIAGWSYEQCLEGLRAQISRLGLQSRRARTRGLSA
jgi:glycosyltransferase involved in cell wall biosynthesis